MNQLQIFNHEEFGDVRVLGDFDNPLFCLADVCRVLELDSSQVMKRLDSGVVSIHPIIDNLGRTQNANFVNEDGLYFTDIAGQEHCRVHTYWTQKGRFELYDLLKHNGYLPTIEQAA